VFRGKLQQLGGKTRKALRVFPSASSFQPERAIVLLSDPVTLTGILFEFIAVQDLHRATGVLDELLLLQNTGCHAHARSSLING
jgi:hypothetical protein